MTLISVLAIDWSKLKDYGFVVTGAVAVVAFVFTYRRTQKIATASARPILQLVCIELSPSRKAIFKNEGGGQAHALCFKTASGEVLNTPNRVLGVNVKVAIPIQVGGGVIDVSFRSIHDEEGQSISAYSELGHVINADQAYGSNILKGAAAAAKYRDLKHSVDTADVRKHLDSAGTMIDTLQKRD